MADIRAIRYGYHHDWIRRHAERTPEKLAMVDLASGGQLSYAQLNARANRLGQLLCDSSACAGRPGLDPGPEQRRLLRGSFRLRQDRRHPEHLNWRLAVPELAYILNDCTPRLLIYEPEFAEAVEALRPNIGVSSSS
jgi:fatty-acyl-CoA synthase